MKSINPYLNFNGNCREAMNFYKECLGGELELMTFGSNPGMEVSEKEKDNILHGKLTINGISVMASDGMESGKVINGTSVTLSIDCSTLEEIEKYFANLSKDGKITMPLQDTFWGARFGMLTDKFGIQWMLNFDKSQK
jgi:PhnB protein